MNAQHSAGKPIAALSENDLPKRAKNALLRSGIATLEEAAEWTDRDLLSLPHMGKVYVASLRALMGQRCPRITDIPLRLIENWSGCFSNGEIPA